MVVWFLARDVFGVAWGATTDTEMVVFEVALISNAAEYADCYEENIIIISQRWMSILLWMRRGQSRPERGAIYQRFNSSVGSGTFFLFLQLLAD